MRIAIIGLGYVGAVSAGCLARDGHQVLGCDIDPSKLELIRSGRTPIIEEGMEELMRDAASSGRLEVIDDAGEALRRSELVFVCVGTPSLPNGGQNQTAILRTTEQLGDALAEIDEYRLIVVRSTVLPGSIEGTIRPLLEQRSGKRSGEAFGLGFQPEFLREGSSIRDYDQPPMTIAGVDSDRAAEMLREVFGHLPCDFITTSVPTAEMVKYGCNVFHALKITFANEMGRVCQSISVDPHEVMGLLCRDTQLNISPAYLKPGFAFGGSCLPKDTRALLHVAKRNDVEMPMLSGLLPSNQLHIEHAAQRVLRSGKRSVGLLGLSFKAGTDDLRESPLVTLAETFIGKGLALKIWDPAVSVARLVGANKRYIEESIPHISSLMESGAETVVGESDVVVVGQGGPAVSEALATSTRDDQLIIDLVNLGDRSKIRGEYCGICW